MIAYSVVILLAWFGTLFIPFWFVPINPRNNDDSSNNDTHFLRG